MANSSEEVSFDFFGIKLVYKDGKAERSNEFPYMPPSLNDPKTGVSSKDITISPEVSARLYLPKLKHPNQKLPVIVYYPGGAFLIDSAFNAAYHPYVNNLASEVNAVIVSVEYRHAPEHFLPAAYEDCWTALQWAASHPIKDANIEKDPWLINHGDFDRVFIAGDSGGGNIAHNIAMRAGTESLPGGLKLVGGIIIVPLFWGSNPIGSMSKEENANFQEARALLFAYPSAPGGIDNPMFNPIADNAPSLAGLGCPRLYICTAEKDILRERGLQYVEAIKKSGYKGELETIDVEGEEHCFYAFECEKSKDLLRRLAAFISKS